MWSSSRISRTLLFWTRFGSELSTICSCLVSINSLSSSKGRSNNTYSPVGSGYAARHAGFGWATRTRRSYFFSPWLPRSLPHVQLRVDLEAPLRRPGQAYLTSIRAPLPAVRSKGDCPAAMTPFTSPHTISSITRPRSRSFDSWRRGRRLRPNHSSGYARRSAAKASLRPSPESLATNAGSSGRRAWFWRFTLTSPRSRRRRTPSTSPRSPRPSGGRSRMSPSCWRWLRSGP